MSTLVSIVITLLCVVGVARADLPSRGIPYITRNDLKAADAFMNQLDVFLPATSAGVSALSVNERRPPAILLFHGGGFTRGLREDIEPLARKLAEAGHVVFNASYRLASEGSPADGYPFPAAFDDAEAAMLWIREHAVEYRVDPDTLVAMGYSAGGTVAAHLGVAKDRRARPALVVSIGGRMDFVKKPLTGDPRKFLVPDGDFRKASPYHAIDDAVSDFEGFYGEFDRIVEAAHGSRMRTGVRKVGRRARVRIVPGADHAGLIVWAVGPGFESVRKAVARARPRLDLQCLYYLERAVIR